MNKTIITLTGPSCSGKSTLEKMLKAKGFVSAVSITTREPRAGEVNGESYYFVGRDDFEAMHARGQFAEWVCFNGNFYGVTKAEFERVFAAGKPVVVVIEPDGRKQLETVAKQEGWDLLRVFVDVKPEVQAKRFLERFATDFHSFDGVDVSAKTDTYAKRLAIMMTTEVSWIAAAHCQYYIGGKASMYDMVVSRFDESTQEAVIQSICNAISEPAIHA